MNFAQFVSFIMFVGILMWFVYKHIPMNRQIRKILTVVLAVSIGLGTAIFFDMFNFQEGFHFGG